jgi:hypothetical protein
VASPSDADIELAFYEQFFFSRDLEPYPVQEEAFAHIFAGDSALITVPTGTGKTLMAKAGIYRALQRGERAVYTTPLRALTEEKYRELCKDFGEDNVGFATGDYKVNRDAPVQVVVAEILWNKIFGDRQHVPADIVIMDEGHYFNDFDRGYVWEQSIIGLDPRAQLVILSATVGHADRFCHWVSLSRRIPMKLVESRDRKVPLFHEYREDYLIDVVRDLAAAGDVPAIIFVFGREKCFETARLLKSCRRFTTDEERARVEEKLSEVLLDGGVADELRSLLPHGIGIHHAGILPRYKQMVEELALERLVKFVVSTETISAGINLPAKRVVFPSLRKYIRRQARLLTPAEFHQMAGRAGRPQFDSEGIAISLAPEDVVQELRKEIKLAKKKGLRVDEEKLRKNIYARATAEAKRREDIVYDRVAHQRLVNGEPAELTSRTRITADQVLAIGLPDLAEEELPDGSTEPLQRPPPYEKLDITTVVDNLLLSDRDKRDALKLLKHVTENLRALGVVDEHGKQVGGEMIAQLHGHDGLFIHYALVEHQFDYDDCRELVELLVDHNVIQRILDRKDYEKRKAWIKEQLRERRRENSLVTWEDVEEDYERQFPRELTKAERILQEFCGKVPHPELHGGKRQKNVWATIEEEGFGFLDFVDRHKLAHEEGSLFSYCARVMKVARAIFEASGIEQFESLEGKVRSFLSVIDARLVAQL